MLRSAVLRQTEPREASSPEDLDRLSDEQIENLWRGTMKQIAQEANRPRH